MITYRNLKALSFIIFLIATAAALILILGGEVGVCEAKGDMADTPAKIPVFPGAEGSGVYSLADVAGRYMKQLI